MTLAEQSKPARLDAGELIGAMARRARAAARLLAELPAQTRSHGLRAAAAALRDVAPQILAANRLDLAAARAKGLGGALTDRLALDEKRVAAMAAGVAAVAELPDPVGTVSERWTRPNGLDISRVRVPLGVIGIIYESRPNVTADAGALCLRAGNAAILRGGSEAKASSAAIHEAFVAGLAAAGVPADAVQLVPVADRAAVGAMLAAAGLIDVIVPRGGKSLVARVQAEARVPVIAHLDGNCHTFVEASADLAMAEALVLNAKMRRTGVCGATETLLVDRACAATHLAPLVEALLAAGCEVRGDPQAQGVDPRVKPAAQSDWETEFLDAVIAVRVVDGIDAAIEHIERYGSHHTDAIVTRDPAAAEAFLARVDSAIVMVNASTQFADGGEFGFGGEIGISTGRLHARGPVGAEQLTTMKYVVRGTGQVRP